MILERLLLVSGFHLQQPTAKNKKILFVTITHFTVSAKEKTLKFLNETHKIQGRFTCEKNWRIGNLRHGGIDRHPQQRSRVLEVHDVPAAGFGAVDALKLSRRQQRYCTNIPAGAFVSSPSWGLRLLIMFARGNPTTLAQGTALGTQCCPKSPCPAFLFFLASWCKSAHPKKHLKERNFCCTFLKVLPNLITPAKKRVRQIQTGSQ